MKAVFRHELSSYFTGMTGYVFGAFLLLFAGIYTMAVNLNAGLSNFEYVLSNLSFIFLIIVPILTMRVIAEERRQRTDQLHLLPPAVHDRGGTGKICRPFGGFPGSHGDHLPVSPGPVGLWLGLSAAGLRDGGGLFLPGCGAAGHWHVSLLHYREPGVAAGLCFVVMLVNYFISDLASYFSASATASFWAFTVLILLVGGIFRLMTRNNGVSLVLVGILEGLLILGSVLGGEDFAGLFPSMVEGLSLFERFYQFVDGVFDLTSLVYFLTVIGVFLFLTVQSLEKRRWSE